MSEISKPDYTYQWASGGSIVAPSDVKIQTGWTAEVPPFQWENWSQNRQDNAILHLFQKGISEWDGASNYYFTASGVRSYVQGSDGVVYVAVQDSLNQNPVTDTTHTYWKVAWIDSTSQAAGGPIAGGMVNAKMAIPAAAATATFTADEVLVKTALAGSPHLIPSFSKTVNLATVGAGGMDTGSAPTNGFVALYAIYNPTTNTSALLATNAATLCPNIYGGANMPSGYTYSSLVSVWITNGSGQFVAGDQMDRRIGIATISVLSSATINATPVTLAVTTLPRNARFCSGALQISSTSSSIVSLTVYDSAIFTAGGQANGATLGAAAVQSTSFSKIAMVTPQEIRWSSSNTAGTPTFGIGISSYEI